MSLEMHVFLAKSKVPDRSAWQTAVETFGIPFELYPALDPIRDSGFSPSKIKGLDSGFEIYSYPAEDVLAAYPEISKSIGDRDWCISFRWGGDMNECVCALTASAALMKSSDAIAYSPEGDELIDDFLRLTEEVRGCL